MKKELGWILFIYGIEDFFQNILNNKHLIHFYLCAFCIILF